MRKKTNKELVAEQESIIRKVLEAVGVDRVLGYMIDEMKNDVYYSDHDIESFERSYKRLFTKE